MFSNNPNSFAGEFLTVPEAAKYAHMSRSQLYELLKRGLIKSFIRKSNPANISGTRLVSRASLDEFTRKQAEAAGAL